MALSSGAVEGRAVLNTPHRVYALHHATVLVFMLSVCAAFVPVAEATKVRLYSLVELLDEADVVLVGRIVESRRGPPVPDGAGWLRIRVEVLTAFKGDVGKEILFRHDPTPMMDVPEYLMKSPLRVLVMGKKSKVAGEYSLFIAYQGLYVISEGRIQSDDILLGGFEEALIADVLENRYRPNGDETRQALAKRVFGMLPAAEPYFGETKLYGLLAAIGEPRSIPGLADRFRKATGEKAEDVRIAIAKTILDIGGETAHAVVLAVYREEHGAPPRSDALRPGIWFYLFGHGRVQAAVPILRKALEQSPDENAVLENVFDALVQIGTEESVQAAFQHVLAGPIEKTRHRLEWLLDRTYGCEDPAFLEKRPGLARQAIPALRRCLSLDLGSDLKEHAQTVLSWLEAPARPESPRR
jgi:hypothetical protein